jgi:hypothetical protein
LRGVVFHFLKPETLVADGIEFIDENGGGPGVRLRKRHDGSARPPLNRLVIATAY